MVRLFPILSIFIIGSLTAYPCANHPNPNSSADHDKWASTAMSKDFFSAPSQSQSPTPASSDSGRPTAFDPATGSFEPVSGPLNYGARVGTGGPRTGRGAASSPLSAPGCCTVCNWGKPCGNTCISRLAVCNQPPGCACGGGGIRETASETRSAERTCTRTCWRGKACGDDCISRFETCTKPAGSACDPR